MPDILALIKSSFAAGGIGQVVTDCYGRTLSRAGQALGVDSLVYNHAVFRRFHEIAKKSAPTLCQTLIDELPSFHTAIDLGCGTGAFVAELRRRGVQARGYEHSPRGRRIAARESGLIIDPFDLNNADLQIACADLAMSTEVAEHLPPVLGDRLVALLAGAAPLVYFTAAKPGQPGQGHIHCQPPEYWAARFERVGHRLEPVFTARLRMRLKASLPTESWWLWDNAMVFVQDRSPATSIRGTTETA